MGNNISIFGNSCPPLYFFGKKRNNNTSTQDISHINLPPFIITPLVIKPLVITPLIKTHLVKDILYDLSFNSL